jgi:PAS domain S-box-containing protein
VLALAGTALAYAVMGWAALWLSIPPSYASPLYPAAGVALACVLVYGFRVLPGVALGAFAVNLSLGPDRGLSGFAFIALPLLIGAGAALQAGLTATLIRRFVKQPFALSDPRDVALFFGIGGVSTALTSSSVAALALWALSAQSGDALLLTWWSWAVGDALGMLTATPIVLSWIGRPRSEWESRRWTVGGTMFVATLLMALSIKQVDRWEEARVHTAFERDALHATSNLAAQLQFPMHALESLRGVFVASENVTRDEMRRAAAAWITPDSHLHALGWSEAVRRADVSAYQAAVRSVDLPSFKVFDRSDSPPPAQDDDRMIVIRYIEPMRNNSTAIGVNARSIAAARAAVDIAVRTDSPAATAGFRLTQETGDQAAVVIYQAVYRGSPKSPAERLDSVLGVVFVTLRMDDALAAFRKALPPYLSICIVDTDSVATRRLLAGPPDCADATAELTYTRPLNFADRKWNIRVLASRNDVPDARARNALLFSLIGLVATSMLGTLLLTVTGRARRIESAVTDRTLALEREIAERERTEAELRESEQRFRNILNHVPIGVVYTDLRGNVKQVNPRFCELTGYSSDDLVQLNLSHVIHPEDRVQDIELTQQLVRGDVPMFRRQGRYVTRDGRIVWVQAVVSLLRLPSGEPYRIVGVVEDITEHLKLADAERARSLAEAANLAKSEFLSRMSHELRTPLNAMLGFAQLLELDQAHPLPAVQRPWVAQIQGAGWHLLDMINDVLDLSRIESGTLSLQMQTLDLREILTSTLALVERDAHRRDITITQDLQDSGTRVKGDATRVKQILTNLLSNAIKYNADSGRIHIATRVHHRDSIEITVTDTGLGMTDEQLSQLFQPFNRLGRERSGQEGTGIGLVISQRLAELMGGALRARSTAGEGSSFILSLPRAADVPERRLDAEPSRPSTGDYHQRVVHYVEDNETNVEVMRGVLSRRPQVRLDVSITGLDGLASIRTNRPDLILLDMHLPDIDGLELLRHLKADPSTADIPVVAVSADALASQIDAALQAGAQQYLTKPISVSELLTAVDVVLDSAETKFG